MTQLRAWHDKHVASHAAFVPSMLIALFYRDPPLLEMALALFPVLVLSTLYHRAREPVGTLLTKCEWVAAFSLYVYGSIQMFHAPTPWLTTVNGLCWAATSSTYLGTNLRVLDWDRWHSVGMHMVPGLWCTVVALWHGPVLESSL